MTKRNRPDLGSIFDPFCIVEPIDDGKWTMTVRTVASPEGLKVWSLNIEPAGLAANDCLPEDAPGAGINTGVLKKISFPEIRRKLASRQNRYLAKGLEELTGASLEDREIITRELARVEDEKARSGDPAIPRRGRRRSTPEQRAQWAEDLLEHKDRHGYRQELRRLWSQREGKPMKVKTVDSRMRLLRDDGWLLGYGKNSMRGPQLHQRRDEHGAGPWKKERSHGED